MANLRHLVLLYIDIFWYAFQLAIYTNVKSQYRGQIYNTHTHTRARARTHAHTEIFQETHISIQGDKKYLKSSKSRGQKIAPVPSFLFSIFQCISSTGCKNALSRRRVEERPISAPVSRTTYLGARSKNDLSRRPVQERPISAPG